jgi:hypothetical protein
MKQFYKIRTPTSEHYAVVKPSKTGKSEIVVGGREYICITISAPNNDLNIRTDAVCYLGLGEQYPNQPGDAKEMLRAAILVAKQTFGECKIELTDLSDKDGMPLSSLMIVFHQQTWYEKWFGAQLKSPLIRKRYQQAIQNFNNPSIKEPSEYFIEFLNGLGDFSTEDGLTTLMDVYNTTTTYKEFFDKLRETFEPPVVYSMIKPWLNAFIDRMGLELVRKETWIVPCNNHNFTDYFIEYLEVDPYNGKYNFVTKKQTGGNGNKKLSKTDKYSLQMQNWIGWLHIKDDEYDSEDQAYLKMLRGRFLD